MSIYARAFTVGDIFTETFAVFTANWRIVAAFGVALGVIAGAVQWGGGDGAVNASKLFGNAMGGTLLMLVFASIAGYIVTWQLLENQGLATTSRSARLFVINVVAGLLMALGMGFAFLLLIVPGLMVMARWSVAPQLIVGRGLGIFEAMGESWALTRSRQWTIVGFYFLFGLALSVVAAPLSVGLVAVNANTGGAGGHGAVGIGIGFAQGVLQYVLSGINMCASVAIFALILDHSGAEEDVFA